MSFQKLGCDESFSNSFIFFSFSSRSKILPELDQSLLDVAYGNLKLGCHNLLLLYKNVVMFRSTMQPLNIYPDSIKSNFFFYKRTPGQRSIKFTRDYYRLLLCSLQTAGKCAHPFFLKETTAVAPTELNVAPLNLRQTTDRTSWCSWLLRAPRFFQLTSIWVSSIIG